MSVQTISDSIQAIMSKRALPGLLLVDPAGRIIFSSDEVQEFLPEIAREISRNGKSSVMLSVCPQIEGFCQDILRQPQSNGTSSKSPPRRAMLFHGITDDYMIMAVSLSRSPVVHRRGLIFLIVQKIGQRKSFDANRLGQVYGLTKREQEVVSRLVEGDSNKEIATSLKIGEYTVKDHLKHIMAKCEVGSRLSIISKALTL